MDSPTMETVRELLSLVVIVLLAGMFGGRIARLMRVPDVAVFLLIGVLIGPILHVVALSPESVADQLLIVVGAALILFDGGRAIGLGVLKNVWLTLLLLAVPGVLITAAVTAGAAAWLLQMPFVLAFLLAAIIASTDPATLIPVFKQVPIEERLKQTVESESAFNDATGSIVTFAVLGVATGEQAFSLGGSLVSFFKMAGGGLLVGLAAGLLAAVLISERRGGLFREYASIVVVTVAVGAYLLGDLLGVSGFMATFTAGIVLGNHQAFRLPVPEAKLTEVSHFFDGITLILRMMIFILLGSQVDFSALADYWLEGLLVVAVFMFVARPLTVLLCAGVDRRALWSWNELLFMCWVRETGVIPAALVALIAGLHLPHYREIHAVTFLAIIVTIVLQAGTTGIVAKKLGILSGENPGKEEFP
ncbi:sodium:proton exchanger [Tumebacillus avium]|uniref:Sodium:proton exchanger n=1 Tax=Tumebacillus avium TaxID=1903704 RepID=A0A1Y0ITB8_9BACL|nr:sodium:proton antiporter [Tumebacillus avium]ARU63036.1 sodium:proton exchanger [Tumebacillus avium]